jgi:hypothetical protein
MEREAAADAPSADATELSEVGTHAIWDAKASLQLQDASRSSHRGDGVAIWLGAGLVGIGGHAATFSSDI